MTGPHEAVALSSRLAANILAELIARGVRDIVVCPGSRSQALALAAAEAERAGKTRLHVRIDERSAAFFALGIARETQVPAAVIVTSGTAVANLMPAVLEAFHARVPMILLSADRPAELRGVRANQTVWRNDFLSDFSRSMVDIPALEHADQDQNTAAVSTKQNVTVETDEYLSRAREHAAEAYQAATEHRHGMGPAHLNIAFRDPLSGGEALVEAALSQGPIELPPEPRLSLDERIALVRSERPGSDIHSAERVPVVRGTIELETFTYGTEDEPPLAVVVAGAGAGNAAADFARAAGVPLLAEPSSGARFGREAIQHWERLLKDAELADLIEQVIVFGSPTLTRSIPALVQRADVQTVVVDAAGPDGPQFGAERFNPGHAVGTFALDAVVADVHDPARMKPWLGAWVVRDRKLRAELTTVHEPDLDAARATGYRERSAYARSEVAVLREAVTRESLTEATWLATWPHDRMVVAASRLIRVLNQTAAPRNISVHANRGLSGIDGTVATALGIAVASQDHDTPAQAAGTTRVLIGDLALLHDAGSLQLTEGEPRPRILLIVGNDGGGTIFDTLEAAETTSFEAFDRVMYTPQNVDIEALARAHGWEYRTATTRGDFERTLTEPVTGPTILNVPLAR
ncbi:MAG: 2-succinyl-5-enolpyruvyl-6-hydroxy-3-cyclohexene-1-carboxylic-acid synthase [Leucobacter sp.]